MEKEITDFEAWEAEKQRYELKDVGAGSIAYALKKDAQGSEPAHYICAACYQHRRKSILQPKAVAYDKTLQCYECKTQLFVGLRPFN